MYTEKFVQTGNSCGAATLMIALHEFDASNPVDPVTEASLYAQTRDPGLALLLGEADEMEYSSSPENIKNTAEGQGLTATLYEKAEIDFLPPELAELKRNYIDGLAPRQVDTAGMKDLLDLGPLQLLVYVDDNPTKMHWLLLRKYGDRYYLYDTAFGMHKEVNPDVILDFNARFTTERTNNFLGVAFSFTKP